MRIFAPQWSCFMVVLKQSLLAIAALIGTILVDYAGAEEWPHWRGPTGLGHSSAKNLPLTWGGKTNENIVWKAPLLAVDGEVRLDNNQSSPIVAYDRVFVTASYWPSANTVKDFPEHHVIAFDARDGK